MTRTNERIRGSDHWEKSAAFAACAIASVIAGCTPVMPGGNGNVNTNTNDNGAGEVDLRGGFVLEQLPGAVLSVSGTSATDVYVVGADTKDGNGPLVLHDDGNTWRRLDTGLEAGSLWWITTPPVEGQFFMSGDPGLILRYDPALGSFQQYATPGTEIVFGVWGSSLTDVWAVGGDLNNADAGGVVWHFDGDSWTVTDLSAIAPDGLPTLYKVWGRGSTEVYACGRVGTILRFDGTAWNYVLTDTSRTLFTIHGNDSFVAATGGSNSGVIEELTGEEFVDHAVITTPQLNGVFVPPTGAAVAVGITGAVALRNVQGGWPVQRTVIDTVLDFHAVWVDDEGGIFAVGGNLGADLNSGVVAYFGDRTAPNSVEP